MVKAREQQMSVEPSEPSARCKKCPVATEDVEIINNIICHLLFTDCHHFCLPQLFPKQGWSWLSLIQFCAPTSVCESVAWPGALPASSPGAGLGLDPG